MGSLEAACIHGFLCRLCSEMHRCVIHIYLVAELAEKINCFLPVTVSPTDPLPKTICRTCLTRVEEHHKLIKMIQNNQTLIKKARECQNSENSETENRINDTNNQTVVDNSESDNVYI